MAVNEVVSQMFLRDIDLLAFDGSSKSSDSLIFFFSITYRFNLRANDMFSISISLYRFSKSLYFSVRFGYIFFIILTSSKKYSNSSYFSTKIFFKRASLSSYSLISFSNSLIFSDSFFNASLNMFLSLFSFNLYCLRLQFISSRFCFSLTRYSLILTNLLNLACNF